jgi:hypothetical protein
MGKIYIYGWIFGTPAGILLEKYGFRAVYDAQSSVEARLSSVIHDGEWVWRPARSEALVDIQTRLTEIKLGHCDKPNWIASRKGIYVSSDTWEALREKRDQIEWWKIVWFSLAIPKQAFILWLAKKDRLDTGVRLLSWGYRGDIQCCFCRNQMESRNHLFFECSFCCRIWKFCMTRCIVANPPIIWEDIIQLGCSSWKCNTLKSLLCRLALGSIVYNIWCTRNEIKHAGHPNTEEQILKKVLWEVRARVAGKGKFPRTRDNILLCSLRNLSEILLC